jgi:hypothetical protein
MVRGKRNGWSRRLLFQQSSKTKRRERVTLLSHPEAPVNLLRIAHSHSSRATMHRRGGKKKRPKTQNKAESTTTTDNHPPPPPKRKKRKPQT